MLFSTQHDELFAISTELLRVAIWSAFHGHQLASQRANHTDASTGSKHVRTSRADGPRARGRARREQLHAALDTLSGQAPPRLTELANAYGTAASPDALAHALTALCALGRAWLKDSSHDAVRRRKATRLTEAWLNETETLASEVRATGNAAAPRAAELVGQGDVDDWDGVNLFFVAKSSTRSKPRTTPRRLSRVCFPSPFAPPCTARITRAPLRPRFPQRQ